MDDTNIIDIETTGNMTRVWVDAANEENALTAAREALGTDARADVVYHDRTADFEVIFETIDLN